MLRWGGGESDNKEMRETRKLPLQNDYLSHFRGKLHNCMCGGCSQFGGNCLMSLYLSSGKESSLPVYLTP